MSTESLPTVPARLPQHLQSTYRQYKADTSRFVGWILETLSNHGRWIEKQDETSSQHRVSTRELVALARELRACKIHVPNGIIELLQSILQRRRRCAEWFQYKAEAVLDVVHNETHQYFIEMLEEVLRMFMSTHHVCPASKTTNSRPVQHLQPTVSDEAEEGLALSADYQRMQLAHSITDSSTDEIAPNALSPQTGQATLGTSCAMDDEATDEATQEEDIEIISPDEDTLFRCFCVLEDLNRIRKYVKELWTKHKHGELPLITASLVTEQAVGLARRLADDFDNISKAEERTYRRMFVEFFFDLACRTRSPSCSDNTQKFDDGLEFDVEVMGETVDWIFLESYVYITRPQTLMIAKKLKKDPSQAQDFPFGVTAKHLLGPSAFPSDGEIYDQYFFSNVSALFDRKGIRFTDSITKSVTEIILSQLDVEESSMEGKSRLVSLSTVFAVQIFIDIQRLLGDQGLAQSAIEVAMTMKTLKSSIEKCRIWFHDTAESRISRTNNGLARVIDEMDRHLTEIWDICSDETHKRLLARNPVMAGIACLHLIWTYNSWSCQFADSTPLLMKGVHIYNAARQEGELKRSWPDLDFVISSHTPQYVFVGDFPRSCSQYLSRLALVCGSSLTKRCLNIDKVRGFNTHLTRLASFLCDLCHLSLSARDRKAEQLELMITAMNKYGHGTKHIDLMKDIGGNLGNAPHLRKLCAYGLQSGPTSLLDGLKQALSDLLPVLYFDYLIIIRRCFDLEALFKKEMEVKVAEISKATQFVGINMQTGLARVFMDLEAYDAVQRKPAHKRGAMELLFRTSLKVVSRLMTEMIEREGDTALAAIKKKLPGYEMPALDFTSTRDEGRTPAAAQEGSVEESVEGPVRKTEMEEYLKGLSRASKNHHG
ncbi:hypothetical protein LTR67_008900 [Exophiala xenobiotica]